MKHSMSFAVAPVRGSGLPTYDLEPAAAMSVGEVQEFSERRERIKSNMKGFEQIAEDLLAIRDKKLYRGEFATYEAFVADMWGRSARWAQQQAAGGVIMGILRLALGNKDRSADGGAGGSPSPLDQKAGGVDRSPPSPWPSPPGEGKASSFPLPTSERQVRPLAQLPAEQVPEVWKEAVDTAPGGKVTARHVERVVAKKTKKWPVPNEHGVFEKWVGERLDFRGTAGKKGCWCSIRILQIGEDSWISAVSYEHETTPKCAGSAPLSLHAERYSTRQEALEAAAVDLENIQREIMSGHRGGDASAPQKKVCAQMIEWCGKVIKHGDFQLAMDEEEEEERPRVKSGIPMFDVLDRAIDLRADLVTLDTELAQLQEAPSGELKKQMVALFEQADKVRDAWEDHLEYRKRGAFMSGKAREKLRDLAKARWEKAKNSQKVTKVTKRG